MNPKITALPQGRFSQGAAKAVCFERLEAPLGSIIISLIALPPTVSSTSGAEKHGVLFFARRCIRIGARAEQQGCARTKTAATKPVSRSRRANGTRKIRRRTDAHRLGSSNLATCRVYRPAAPPNAVTKTETMKPSTTNTSFRLQRIKRLKRKPAPPARCRLAACITKSSGELS